MRTRDTFDVMCSLAALAADAAAIFGGFLRTWLRFDSGWIPLKHELPPPRDFYLYAALVGTLLFLFIFGSLGLYVRPQTGRFEDRLPRIVRATAWGIFLAYMMASIIRIEPPISRAVTALSFLTIADMVLLERYVLFRFELHWARRREQFNRVLVIGADEIAARLRQALQNDPRLGARVVAFLTTRAEAPAPGIPPELIRGKAGDFEGFLDRGEVNQVVLADTSLPHEIMSDIILSCERRLIPFLLVPDIFGVLTSKVEVRHIGDVPLVGVKKWPLDFLWNRVIKRSEDIVGAALGLVLSSPVLLVAALLIRRSGPGPVVFRQVRCGEGGHEFSLYKLRTMVDGAEEDTGPVWAAPDDPRRTRIGSFLRRNNLDELPQLWNVLRGDMSLVGPRPERPHFVEQFKADIERYMSRHVYRPGMTGWAQVNGLRGNTSIGERIKHDLYYLENWSLAFDFKILVKTFLHNENAY